MNMRICLLVISLFIYVNFSAQNIVGLWEVSSVFVGEEKMTPVAKWMKIKKDLSFESGNGWTKNSEGSIELDEKSMLLEVIPSTGLEDPFGPFKIDFHENEMIWTRMEEGLKVVVSAIPVDALPMGPADKIQGLWKQEGSEDLLFIRPDMRYRILGDKADNGIWHMDGHRPIMTLISREESKKHMVYEVKFQKGDLLMKSNEESAFAKYSRLRKFPE